MEWDEEYIGGKGTVGLKTYTSGAGQREVLRDARAGYYKNKAKEAVSLFANGLKKAGGFIKERAEIAAQNVKREHKAGRSAWGNINTKPLSSNISFGSVGKKKKRNMFDF